MGCFRIGQPLEGSEEAMAEPSPRSGRAFYTREATGVKATGRELAWHASGEAAGGRALGE